MQSQQTIRAAPLQRKITPSNPHLYDHVADDVKEDVEDNIMRLQQQALLVKDEEEKY